MPVRTTDFPSIKRTQNGAISSSRSTMYSSNYRDPYVSSWQDDISKSQTIAKANRRLPVILNNFINQVNNKSIASIKTSSSVSSIKQIPGVSSYRVSSVTRDLNDLNISSKNSNSAHSTISSSSSGNSPLNNHHKWENELYYKKKSAATFANSSMVNSNSVSYDETNNMSSLSKSGLVGLQNLGNTCLSNTSELLMFCLNERFKEDLNKNSNMHGSLFSSYAELMNQMWKSNKDEYSSAVSPSFFKAQIQKFAPRFMGYSQQDAQEFLRYLLEGLHEDVNRVRKRPQPVIPDYKEEDKLPDREKSELYWNRYLKRDNSVIVDIFMGQLMSTLQCKECGFKSTTFDPFWDLSLPISKSSGQNTGLTDCMRLFTAKEELSGDEKPMCGKCKQRRQCTKSFSIQRFPRILVLHLKRFSGDRYRSKMNTMVNYPVERLDLKEYASPHCTNINAGVYHLYAVSNHSGGCYSGHYTAYCKHPVNNTWQEYNDSSVRSARESSIVSPEGYVLFYSSTGS